MKRDLTTDIESLFAVLKTNWETFYLLHEGINFCVGGLFLCRIANEVDNWLKDLEKNLQSRIPDELTSERVDKWIDQNKQINQNYLTKMEQRIVFLWMIGTEEDMEIRECAKSLARFLPPTNEPDSCADLYRLTDECRRFASTYYRLSKSIIVRLQAINERLYNPTDSALESVYLHTRKRVVVKEALDIVLRESGTFQYDYRTKPDYQQRLKQRIEQLSNEIQNHWYSPEWDYFFHQNETGEYVVDRIEVGRLLYRQRERFKVEEKDLIHFLCQLEQWNFLQNELVKVQKSAHPATPTVPQPTPVPATDEANPNLLKTLSEKLLSCDQALAKLKLLLVAIDPLMNTSNGQHDKKRRWSHLYKAWLEAGFVKDNITDADFGHLIHALLPSRSSKSVYNTLYRDKEKMGSIEFKAIVEPIKAHFQPVADLVKGSRH